MSRRKAKVPAITSDDEWWTPYVYQWLRAHVVHQEDTRVDCDELYAAYLAWWRDPSVWGELTTEPTMREFGLALIALCRAAGVPVHVQGDRAYCLGCRLALAGEFAAT
jgi:hypothetical protein